MGHRDSRRSRGLPLLSLSTLLVVNSLSGCQAFTGGGMSMAVSTSRKGDSAGKSDIKKVAIIGAGSGGLALANALMQMPTGVQQVTVYDRFGQIKAGLGGGVQINGAAAICAKMGLGPDILKAGNAVQRIRSRKVDGTPLLDIDVPQAIGANPKAKEALSYEGTTLVLTIMRDSFLQLLARKLPRGSLKFNKKLVGIDTDSDPEARGRPCLQFEGSTKLEGPFDLVVGADGINSVVGGAVAESRGTKLPQRISAGIRVRFGVGPANLRPEGCDNEIHQWMGVDFYALSASYGGGPGGKSKGKESAMVAAVTRAGPNEKLDENEGWKKADTETVKSDIIASFKKANFPPEMMRLADGCQRFFDVGVYYRNPLVPWASKDSKVVLLGDAAHAMPPFLGQGVNQAVQDGYCLAERLARLNSGEEKSLASAVKSYERARKPVVVQLLLQSLLIGNLEAAPTALGGWVRDTFFWTTGKLGVAKGVFVNGAIPKV